MERPDKELTKPETQAAIDMNDPEDLRQALAENYTRTWREQFNLQKDEPIIWGDQAFELVHVSNLLNATYQSAQLKHDVDPMNYYEPKFSMVPIYELRLIKVVYYFRGLALENFLKGILVAREIAPPRSHNLRKLANLAGVSFSDRQMLLLDELTAVVTWYGRYHIPLSQDEMTPRIGLRDFPSIPGELGHQEQEEVIGLLTSTIKCFNQSLKEFVPIREARAAAERTKNTADSP